MRRFKKLLYSAILSLALCVGFSTVVHAVSVPLKNGKSAAASGAQLPPSFLFVLQADKATLAPMKDKKDHYTMSIPLSNKNLKNVIEFSDRPYRIVKQITAQHLQDMWGEGADNFEVDPPNAVLSANEHAVEIIVINSFTIKNEILEMEVYRDSGGSIYAQERSELVHVVVTIDNFYLLTDSAEDFLEIDALGGGLEGSSGGSDELDDVEEFFGTVRR